MCLHYEGPCVCVRVMRGIVYLCDGGSGVSVSFEESSWRVSGSSCVCVSAGGAGVCESGG